MMGQLPEQTNMWSLFLGYGDGGELFLRLSLRMVDGDGGKVIYENSCSRHIATLSIQTRRRYEAVTATNAG